MQLLRWCALACAFASLAGSSWVPPLEDPLRVVASFSLPGGPFAAGHRGIDLPASAGEAVRSPARATISFVGIVVDRPVVSLQVDAMTVVSLEPVFTELRVGDAVSRGELIGRVAQGGHCASNCLHLGVRVANNYVNPLRFLRPKPVLLPTLPRG